MAKWNGDRALEILTLSLDRQVFAIEAAYVREILDPGAITEVPGARAFVGGLINVRGKVVPLANLRLRFGMPPHEATIDTRIVVIEIDGEPVTVGLLADKVYEVTEIAADALEETPRIGLRLPHEFIRCVGKRGDDFIIVLDIARVFASGGGENSENIPNMETRDAA